MKLQSKNGNATLYGYNILNSENEVIGEALFTSLIGGIPRYKRNGKPNPIWMGNIFNSTIIVAPSFADLKAILQSQE